MLSVGYLKDICSEAEISFTIGKDSHGRQSVCVKSPENNTFCSLDVVFYVLYQIVALLVE